MVNDLVSLHRDGAALVSSHPGPDLTSDARRYGGSTRRSVAGFKLHEKLLTRRGAILMVLSTFYLHAKTCRRVRESYIVGVLVLVLSALAAFVSLFDKVGLVELDGRRGGVTVKHCDGYR